METRADFEEWIEETSVFAYNATEDVHYVAARTTARSTADCDNDKDCGAWEVLTGVLAAETTDMLAL